MRSNRWAVVVVLLGCWGTSLLAQPVPEGTSIQLAREPALSPDGKWLAFSWRGDLWLSSSTGGTVRRLTDAPGNDSHPAFSPDGKTLAFVSQREGVNQVFTMSVDGGPATQLTFHSEGCTLEEWTASGKLLINAQRDHFWRQANRLFEIEAKPRPFERMLFDADAREGCMSPDETQVLLTREGTQWWRKGYRGSQAAQLWLFQKSDNSFRKVLDDDSGVLSPLWSQDGKAIYFLSQRDGTFDLYRSLPDGSNVQQLTNFADDSIVMPCIARDGSRIVFRHLFDFYSLDLTQNAKPQKIELRTGGDYFSPRVTRETLSAASEAAFSNDGLEVVFVAGGDLWVMDTELREPIRVTSTPEFESSPIFGPDGNSILYVSDSGGQTDIWSVTREEQDKYWWQNNRFTHKRLTEDSEKEEGLQLAPTNDAVAFRRGEGQLWMMSPDGTNPKKLVEGWNVGSFDWAPDGKWITYAQQDNEFNSDIWILPVDLSRPPYNVSTHPDNDANPTWSPDGKVIAFVGRRFGEESDLFFVYLTNSEEETTARDRKLKEALEKMKKSRKPDAKKSGEGSSKPDAPKDPAAEPAPAKTEDPAKQDPAKQDPSKPAAAPESKEPAKAGGNGDDKEKPKEDEKVVVKIDFDGLADRLRQVPIPNADENGLFWSFDSKKLAFVTAVEGKRGVYTVTLAEELKPTLLTSTVGSNPRWLKSGDQIVWLVSGVPGNLTANGTKANAFTFSVRHEYVIAEKFGYTFDLAWQVMRDTFYDGHLNNRNWNEIRRKYRDMAQAAFDLPTLADVINLMLGELNASHLGFQPTREEAGPRNGWQDVTAHFGTRFDPDFKGPGWKVRDVIYRSPAWQSRSRIEPGEIILAINGREVDPAMEVTEVLNGRLDREMVLKVKNAAGETRDVSLRPISYAAVRGLLYEHWIRHNQQLVEQASQGKLGYLHIQGMSMPSFYRFERELYHVGNGKDGIVIDVRENGGGSTADHLLTILTQPVHAITVPRGGGPGYPQDRKIYASWDKPIVVLCNQNSFSNAEIFSHAIKTLKRGKLVGVPTAGGVISTGGTGILDMGFLRKPFRGWYLVNDGQDMELNGAVPDHILWPEPTEWPSGIDRQLQKAVEVLQADVAAEKAKPVPTLVPASQRPGRK